MPVDTPTQALAAGAAPSLDDCQVTDFAVLRVGDVAFDFSEGIRRKLVGVMALLAGVARRAQVFHINRWFVVLREGRDDVTDFASLAWHREDERILSQVAVDTIHACMGRILVRRVFRWHRVAGRAAELRTIGVFPHCGADENGNAEAAHEQKAYDQPANGPAQPAKPAKKPIHTLFASLMPEKPGVPPAGVRNLRSTAQQHGYGFWVKAGKPETTAAGDIVKSISESARNVK